jgi:hypothetical protein
MLICFYSSNMFRYVKWFDYATVSKHTDQKGCDNQPERENIMRRSLASTSGRVHLVSGPWVFFTCLACVPATWVHLPLHRGDLSHWFSAHIGSAWVCLVHNERTLSVEFRQIMESLLHTNPIMLFLDCQMSEGWEVQDFINPLFLGRHWK